MKKLTKEFQISTQSHREILPAFEQLAGKLSETNTDFLTKKVTYGHILNGLMLLVLDRSEDERLELARDAVKRLEEWAAGESFNNSSIGHPLTVLPRAKRKKPSANDAG